MGISFSCPGCGHADIDGELEALTVRSISFKGEDVNSIIRTLSFKESHTEPSHLKSYGSGKMVVEGSLSFKRSKMDPFQVETTFSITSSPTNKEDTTGISSFKSSERKIFDEASPKPCVSDLDDPNIGVVKTAFSTNHPSSMEEDSITTCSFGNSGEESPEASLSEVNSPKHKAAVKLQKVYKSFRTRRQLADCAVLVEQSWWKLLDFALLKHSSVSFFDVEKPESVVSRWSRARTRAAKVGKGLSKDEKAQKLTLQHWLEAIDPRHRYGHNLHLYYIRWLHCESRQPFFYWLDVGEGKEVTHERCSRSKLQQQSIKYLGPNEREAYEVIVEDGRLTYKQNGQFVDTSGGNEGSKWIFVLSTSKRLYVGQKKKGNFQHSSFLAGGATSSAGRLVVDQGILKAIWPHSGHYRPTEENFQEFISFLEENNVDLTNVKRSPADDETWSGTPRISSFRNNSSRFIFSQDLTVRGAENVDGKPDELHRRASRSTSLKNTTDLSVELEAKTCCSPAAYQVAEVDLEESCAPIDVHAPLVQDMFRGSDVESDEDIETDDMSKSIKDANGTNASVPCEQQNSSSLMEAKVETSGSWKSPGSSGYRFHKKNLFQEKNDNEGPPVPPELILNRINSMKGANSTQLGKQFFTWTSGAGPRISCVRDYPSELQVRALEQVSLSPRSTVNSGLTAICSPRIIATNLHVF